MIPARFSNVLFGFLLSGIMTFVVSFISTVRALGISHDDFFSKWMQSYATSWLIAFPIVLFVAPLVRKAVAKLTA